MANSFDNELETPEMEKLSSLAENIVYRVPGCDNLMVRKVLQDVYRDFCRRSCCLCGRRHFIVTPDDMGRIPVRPMFGGVVDSIVDVIYDRRHLHSNDYAEMNGCVVLADRFVPDESCDERHYPNVDVVFIEMPKLNSEDVPAWFVQKHGESVVSGVMNRLMSMTGKPWSDPTQAAVENIRYENAINEERLRFHSGHSSGDCGSMVCTDELI